LPQPLAHPKARLDISFIKKNLSFFNAGIKGRLAALMLLGFVPALGYSVYHATQDFTHHEVLALDNTVRLTALMSENQKQLIDASKTLLLSISRLPIVETAGGKECQDILTHLSETFPVYNTFALVAPNGKVICSANPVKIKIDVSGLPFFVDVINSHAPVMGEYEIDRSTNKSTMFIAAPTCDAPGKLQSLLGGSLNVSLFDQLQKPLDLPKDSVLMVFSNDGLIFACYPDPAGTVGRYVPFSPAVKRIIASGMDHGTLQAPGNDQIDRLYAYTVIHKTDQQKVYLALGFTTTELKENARQSLYGSLINLLLIYALISIIIWKSSDILILRKIQSLTQAMRRIRNGDLTARTGFESGGDEIGRFARSFDEMAEKMQKRVSEMKKIKEMTDALGTCLTVEEVLTVSERFMRKLLPKNSVAIYLINDNGEQLISRANWGIVKSATEFSLTECWAIRRGKSYCVTTSRSEPRCRHVNDVAAGSYICVPMLARGEVRGLLHLQSNAAIRSHQEECAPLPLAEILAEHIALTLAGLSLREMLHGQAMRDPLTGLFNRRYMEEAVEREVRRADRNNAPFVMIMIDIDNFKIFNDTYGHAAGDAILRECGKLFQSEMRGEDFVCRYGGEEFTIVLPGAHLENGRVVAEKLRAKVPHITIYVNDQPVGDITISLGVAVYPGQGPTWEDVLYTADKALLLAKQTRNRVMCA